VFVTEIRVMSDRSRFLKRRPWLTELTGAGGKCG
jgi:hypothetical protein